MPCTDQYTEGPHDGGHNVPGFWSTGKPAAAVAAVMAMKLRASLFGILILTTATMPIGAGERVSMKVSPAVAFAPANLVVRASVEADEQNRSMQIVAESRDFYRSSEVQLEGDKAPRTSMIEFRNLPPGTYDVRVVLMGSGGHQRAFARQQVSVIASGAGH
jgi:predicted phage tail protein